MVMKSLLKCFFFLFLSWITLPLLWGNHAGNAQIQSLQGNSLVVLERYIAIDNVCAWPNLTYTPEGNLVATIFNQPSHGQKLGT